VNHAVSPAAGAQSSAPARPAGLSLTVRIRCRDGRYGGAVEQLPGCSAEGASLDMLLLLLVSAIAEHPDVQREVGDLAGARQLAEISGLELFIPRFA
jgi:predicted RNase H-like HicB family nuclease